MLLCCASLEICTTDCYSSSVLLCLMVEETGIRQLFMSPLSICSATSMFLCTLYIDALKIFGSLWLCPGNQLTICPLFVQIPPRTANSVFFVLDAKFHHFIHFPSKTILFSPYLCHTRIIWCILAYNGVIVVCYGLQIWPAHSQGPSEQKPIENFGEKGAWTYLGTSQFFGYHFYLING